MSFFPQSFTFARDQLRRLGGAKGRDSQAAQYALDRLHYERKLLTAAEDKRQAIVTVQTVGLRNQLSSIQARLADAQRPVTDHFDRTDLADAKRDLEEQLRIAETDAHELGGQITALSKRTSAVETKLRDARQTQAVLRFTPVRPMLGTPGAVSDVIADARARLSDVEERRREVEAAILPREVAMEMVKAELTRRAAPPFIGRIVENAEGAIYFPQMPVHVQGGGGGGPVAGGGNIPDALGLLVWLFGDLLESRLGKLVDEYSEDRFALAPAERRKRLAQLDADKLAAERDEEWAVWCGLQLKMKLGSEPGQISLRENADFRAIIGLADDPFGPPGSVPQDKPSGQEQVLKELGLSSAPDDLLSEMGLRTGKSQFVGEKPTLPDR